MGNLGIFRDRKLEEKFEDGLFARNRVYIHDLDLYASGMHNCLSIPIDRLLEDGFVVRQQVIREGGK